MKNRTKAVMVGMMSGTSLDGVDLAAVVFDGDPEAPVFEWQATDTLEYTEEWRKWLAEAPEKSGAALLALHHSYGRWVGEQVREFCRTHSLKPRALAAHGHTVFHRPEQGWTFQLGEGHAMAVAAGMPVVSDLRSADTALGGQGAPLVPIGDLRLYPGYDAWLNLGGFANVTIREEEDEAIAFDICPLNIALNHLAERVRLRFDYNGELARKGVLIPQLLARLNDLSYYCQPSPKSLGREWLETHFLPLLAMGKPVPDLLHTCCLHMAYQIKQALAPYPVKKMLVSGGGGLNGFLVELLRTHLKEISVEVADNRTLAFKEALIFAYLGWLKLRGSVNIKAQVTGASRDSTGGVVYEF